MRTDKYYFDGLNETEFRELQKAAWDGQLDYSMFPACEYKFFDAVRIAGYRYRHEKHPMDFCRADIAEAKRVYSCETEERRYSLEVHKKYQDAILKSDELRCRLTKAAVPAEKLKIALIIVEKLTGEDGLTNRELRYLNEGT